MIEIFSCPYCGEDIDLDFFEGHCENCGNYLDIEDAA